MAVGGGLLRRTYETGASFAERTARRPVPSGTQSAEWIPGVLLVIVAVSSALILLRTGASVGGPAAVDAPDATTYGSSAPVAADVVPSWNMWDLTAVLLPWSIPLVVGGVGLTDTAFVRRSGSVAGVLLVGLGGAALTSLLDLLAVGDGQPPRWLGFVYLLRFGFAVQILVGMVLWVHLAAPRHRTALNAALAATLAAALPLMFSVVGDDLLLQLWKTDAVLQTALPIAGFLLVLMLLPTGMLLVREGQGWPRVSWSAFRGIVALGLAGVVLAVWKLVDGGIPKVVGGLWPVVALVGCLVTAGMTYRLDGVRSIAGSLLAMAVGLAALPAALFGFDRTSFNPGLGFDGAGESTPWILALAVAGLAGALAARLLGPYAIGFAAIVLVVGAVIGADSGETHILITRCAGALALGVVIGSLPPEPALAALGLTAACGPVWPELQDAAAEYSWVEVLSERPWGVPFPLLVFAALAVPLSVWAGLRRPGGGAAGQGPSPVGAYPYDPSPIPAQVAAEPPQVAPEAFGPGPMAGGSFGPGPSAVQPPAPGGDFGRGLGPGPRRGELGRADSEGQD